ncbi:TolC family protein [Spirosoma oryzicola]|uniref:TolC family protein n=1 Tax=Spirosoma oryzicola TaxID=2898794 RepID=UPI001E550B43|nr:TolC family protein [Spirosoma oryzicola]UHG92344.1 TolC family protein [Spirosoma oryzicola]
MRYLLTLLGVTFGAISASAQSYHVITLPEALARANSDNPQVNVANLRIDKQRALIPGALSLSGPELIFEAPTTTRFQPGVLLPVSLPTVYKNQRIVQEQQVKLSQREKGITTNTLRYNVRTVYNNLLYLRESITNYRRQDSLLLVFTKVTETRQRVGQISRIEVLNARSQQQELNYQLDQTRARVRSSRIQLGLLIGTPNDTSLRVTGPFQRMNFAPDSKLAPLLASDSTFIRNPQTSFYEQNQQLSESLLKLEKKRRLPNIIVGYLNQGGPESPLLYRFRFGLSLPVWGWVARSRINAAQTDVAIAKSQITLNQYELRGDYDKAIADYLQYQEALDYYTVTGLPQAEEIIKAASDGYRLGSIGYYDYLLNVQQAFKIRQGYLDALLSFNQAVITLHYIKGE